MKYKDLSEITIDENLNKIVKTYDYIDTTIKSLIDEDYDINCEFIIVLKNIKNMLVKGD